MVTLKTIPKAKIEWVKLAISSLILSIFIIWASFFHLLGKLERLFGKGLGNFTFTLLVMASIFNIAYIAFKISKIRNIGKEEDSKLAALKEFFEKRGVKF